MNCFHEEPDERDEWSFATATLYGFGVMTTLVTLFRLIDLKYSCVLGYNRIAPATIEGRMFCILYGLCGIPVTMIIIANIGHYLHTFAGLARKKVGQVWGQLILSLIFVNW